MQINDLEPSMKPSPVHLIEYVALPLQQQSNMSKVPKMQQYVDEKIHQCYQNIYHF